MWCLPCGGSVSKARSAGKSLAHCDAAIHLDRPADAGCKIRASPRLPLAREWRRLAPSSVYFTLDRKRRSGDHVTGHANSAAMKHYGIGRGSTSALRRRNKELHDDALAVEVLPFDIGG